MYVGKRGRKWWCNMVENYMVKPITLAEEISMGWHDDEVQENPMCPRCKNELSPSSIECCEKDWLCVWCEEEFNDNEVEMI